MSAAPIVIDVPVRLLQDLDEAVLGEDRAKRTHRAAVERVVEVARTLQRGGWSFGRIARRVARALGLPASQSEFQRISAMLRKRLTRKDARHRNRAHAANEASAAAVDLSSFRGEKGTMAKLIKKTTVTEEFIEDPETDEECESEGPADGEDGDEGGEMGDAVEERPRRRSPGRR